MTWPRTALFSLSDRAGAAAFARALAARGTRLLASGGTAAHLREAGLEVDAVETLTGFAELLGGRVKTLHPHVHAGILARRDVAADMEALAERDLPPIDLVAVTLYPFESRARMLAEPAAMEEVDIGGVALLRAAAKNWASVIVIHDPSQYGEVLGAIEEEADGPARRRAWAMRCFARTARYDAAIAAELERRGQSGDAANEAALPALQVLALDRVRTLRYGENPHQAAALYARTGGMAAVETWKEGKELSYNNLLDLDAAAALVWRYDEPACVIVKHTQPCGVACAGDLVAAYRDAFHADELSAFGGIVAFNRPLDAETAAALAPQFVECVAAPAFEPAAEAALAAKKNLRAVRLGGGDVSDRETLDTRLLGRWALLQRDATIDLPPWRLVTRRAAEEGELRSLRFAWPVAAAARSNAVALARGTALKGLGSGQTSRVDAVDVAILKARRAGHDLAGAVLASDGFFPFADNIEHAAAAGIRAIVQPGGSLRDDEVIAACDRLGLAMLFTGRRTFRH